MRIIRTVGGGARAREGESLSLLIDGFEGESKARSVCEREERRCCRKIERGRNMKGASRTYLDVPWQSLIFSAEHPLIYFSFHPVLLDNYSGQRNKATSGPTKWGDNGGA